MQRGCLSRARKQPGRVEGVPYLSVGLHASVKQSNEQLVLQHRKKRFVPSPNYGDMRVSGKQGHLSRAKKCFSTERLQYIKDKLVLTELEQ